MSTPQRIAGEVPSWSFGDRLRKARRYAGLKQEELAAKVGVKTNVLSNWEAEANGPRDIVTVSKKVALATGVPQAWLLLGDTYSTGPDSGPDTPSGLRVSDSLWRLQTPGLHLLQPTG